MTRRLSSRSLTLAWMVPAFGLAACHSGPLNTGASDAGAGCDYAGVHHPGGSTFPSSDGCNSCSCNVEGEAQCTLTSCSGTGGASDSGTGGASNSGTGGASGGGTGGASGACGPGSSLGATPGWIVFDADQVNFNRDIYKIRPDGTQLTRLTTDVSIEKEPAVSPDGRWMTFTSDRDGSLQIYLVDLQTNRVTKLTSAAGGADQSSFSHDSTLIAFHSGASVYTIPVNGTDPSLIATGAGSYFWPQFSADDRQLVFDRENEMDVVGLDGTGFRMIVQNWTTTIKAPSVSPAGGEIAYYVNCSGVNAVEADSIWTTPFATKTNPCAGRRLTPVSAFDAHHPAWGPNDIFAYEQIDQINNIGTIALLARTPGAAPCIITAAGVDSRNPTWSP